MHRTLEYAEGSEAYYDGEGTNTCPYLAGKDQTDPDKADAWLQGWQDACDSE